MTDETVAVSTLLERASSIKLYVPKDEWSNPQVHLKGRRVKKSEVGVGSAMYGITEVGFLFFEV